MYVQSFMGLSSAILVCTATMLHNMISKVFLHLICSEKVKNQNNVFFLQNVTLKKEINSYEKS